MKRRRRLEWPLAIAFLVICGLSPVGFVAFLSRGSGGDSSGAIGDPSSVRDLGSNARRGVERRAKGEGGDGRISAAVGAGGVGGPNVGAGGGAEEAEEAEGGGGVFEIDLEEDAGAADTQEDGEHEEERERDVATGGAALAAVDAASPRFVQLLRYKERRHLFISRENVMRIRSKDPMSPSLVSKLLPRVSPQPHHNTCAIVGNSGVLKRSHYGPDIDRHDIVVRLNQAPTAGYEPIVGSRTSYRFLNFKWTSVYYEDNIPNTAVPGGTKQLARYLINAEQAGTILVVSRAHTRMFEQLAVTQRRRRPDLKTAYLSSRMVSQVREAMVAFRGEDGGVGQQDGGGGGAGRRLRGEAGAGREGGGGGSRGEITPSTGLLGIFFLLQVCDHVSVYGLSLQMSRIMAEMRAEKLMYHYFKKWADSERLSAHDHHSFKLEGQMLSRLHDEGFIRLCVNRAVGSMKDSGCGWA